jgi:hypothetical protein
MKHIEVEVAWLSVKWKLWLLAKAWDLYIFQSVQTACGDQQVPCFMGNGDIFPCVKPPRWTLSSNAETMCGGVPTLLHTSSCRGAQVSAGTICTWRQSVDWISRDDTESFIFLLNQIYFWRGEFDVTCLLLIQKDSDVVTVIIFLRYDETD